MQTIEIIGFKRANLGKKEANELRAKGQVPCVLYGGSDQVHFSVPAILFRDLVYTPNVYMVDLSVEGTPYKAILQDAQFHPTSEVLLHADFLELNEDKPIRMEVPVRLTGTALGVTKGGKINQKMRKLSLRALPANMPDFVEVDITPLDLGKSAKVSAVAAADFQILNALSSPIVTIDIPRALRGKQAN